MKHPELSLLAILLLVLLIFSQIVYPRLENILNAATKAEGKTVKVKR